MESTFTKQQLLEVPCITCDAKAGKPCMVDPIHEMIGFHRLRQQLREKFPVVEMGELNATDKSLICYYAFVMLSESVSSQSEKLFGKHFSSQEIQIKFAREAVKELKKDGLLK